MPRLCEFPVLGRRPVDAMKPKGNAQERQLQSKEHPNGYSFGTIKAQTLSNQIGVVLVFIIMRWIRPDEVAFRVMHPEIKVSAAHLVIMIRLSRLEMQKHLPSNEPK